MKKQHRKHQKQQPLLIMQKELEHTRIRIETLENNFENVTDHDLIDSFIFERSAAWKRNHFLLRQIRNYTMSS